MSGACCTGLFQTYPAPTELPAMRETELDGRYMDCSPALLPVGDSFVSLDSVNIVVTRRDGAAMGTTDLQSGVWDPVLGPATGNNANTIVTFGWFAPPGSGGSTYLLTLTANPTKEGRIFVRDWVMSVLPFMG